MTVDEMSHEFDVLASSYLREGGFAVSDGSLLAFNEYEKSVYLTREQESLVLALYSDRSSSGSFEKTEELRRDLENLLTEEVLKESDTAFDHIVSGSQLFTLPEGLWFIVYEAGRYRADAGVPNCPDTADGFPVEIVPVTHDVFHRVVGDPFRGPNRRRALRLDNGKRTGNHVEIVSKYPIGGYYVKYIRRPHPILLVDLDDGLSINGEGRKSGCELHESLHRMVLDGAVRMAVSSRVGGEAQSEKS